ncbi:MAG TPA: sigma-70 family RNA polymerase sigma factor [Planctomycetota bacterium]|nr:sigma-70 family RNA polymerase sigma factor [Planctomycetota bacterium]
MVPEDFPETRWSQLLDLRDPSHPAHQEHLERLARQYWKPVYHYIRALRPSADAEDLAQQYFTLLLSRRDLERLSPDRGSFRGFLKTSLRNFLASADRSQAARPRLFPFEEAEAAWKEDRVPPEQAFDREWARGVLLEATARLRRELKPPAFEIFQEYCLEDTDLGYGALAQKHGVSENDVRNRLREARLRLREILEEMLRDYLLPGQSVEDELRFILAR